MNKQYRLAVDFDGTMARYEDGLRAVVANARNVPVESLPPADSWDFANWGMARGEFMTHHTAFVQAGGFKALEFYEGAHSVLLLLKKIYNIHISIVTHRLMVPGHNNTIVKDTIENLEANGIPYDDILFVEDKSHAKYDLLIDDAPKHYEACTSAGKNVLIFDQPYNRHIEGPRVTNWFEVYDYVLNQLAVDKHLVS